VRALAALAAAGLTGPGGALRGFHLWQPPRRSVILEEFSAVVEVLAPETFRVVIGGESGLCERRDGWWIGGEKLRARLVVDAAGIHVFAGRGWHFRCHDPLARASEGPASGLTLSPMPGLVKAVFVDAGQQVTAGDRLAVLEAMKMEHTLTAARDGRVAEVLAAPGAQVEAGQPLIRLEEEA
jgi:3-methylcrotonyl-CoA carboxylase alpha subunit